MTATLSLLARSPTAADSPPPQPASSAAASVNRTSVSSGPALRGMRVRLRILSEVPMIHPRSCSSVAWPRVPDGTCPRATCYSRGRDCLPLSGVDPFEMYRRATARGAVCHRSGHAVAISGDTALVGARSCGTGGQIGPGRRTPMWARGPVDRCLPCEQDSWTGAVACRVEVHNAAVRDINGGIWPADRASPLRARAAVPARS